MATPVLMPRQGQSVESCILVDWLVAPGSAVKTGQPLASIETDKAVFEVESPADGTLLETFFKKGDDIPVLTTIAAIGSPGEDTTTLRPGGAAATPPSPPPNQPIPQSTNSSPTPHTSHPTSSAISPRARAAAAKTGVDATSLAGSGPGGRVIARDVQAASANASRLTPAAKAAAKAGGLSAPATGSGPGGMILTGDLSTPGTGVRLDALAPSAPTETPLTGIRKIIAERMRHSLASTAQLSLFRSFDATALQAYRRQVKTEGEKFGLPNITINDMLVYAAARTLARHPDLNAHFLGDRIARFASVNIGVATDTPRGLMVPVLKQAHTLSLADVSRQLKPILAAAQAGNITPDQLKGGTFTITNMGMLGVEQFTPILNAPEVAILGIGGLVLKPVERDGAIHHVQSISLSLTIDHQAVDGAPGARFLQDLTIALENFSLTLTANG